MSSRPTLAWCRWPPRGTASPTEWLPAIVLPIISVTCPKPGLAIVLLVYHRSDVVNRREARELTLDEGRATVRRADDENRYRRGRMDSAARDLLVVLGIEASPNAHLLEACTRFRALQAARG